MSARCHLRAFATAAIVLCAVFLPPSPAAAQTYIDEANSLYRDIVPQRRSGPVILPAIARIARPPLAVDEPRKAALLFEGASGWSEAASWATGETQRAALDALRRVTSGDVYETAPALAQPYGVEGVSSDLIRAGMYTELGDPPLLAAAEHLYLDAVRSLRCLAHVEATRLVGEGRAGEAADVMLRMAIFGRQLADRAFFEEALAGYEIMIDSLRRLRDVLYVDFRGERSATASEIGELIPRLDRKEGLLAMDRLRLPLGDRIAAEQLIDVVYEERRDVDEARFLATMVRLGSAGRPLRRFSVAAEYRRAVADQQDWFEARETLGEIYGAWVRRWELPPWDSVLALPTPWELGRAGERVLAVREGIDADLGELFALRKIVETERVGCRLSLAHLGWFYEVKGWARERSTPRARWLGKDLEADPFNPELTARSQPPLQFFVPVRDDFRPDRRADPRPHTMEVFPPAGENFEVVLTDDTFVLYSVGANGVADGAERVSQDPDALLGDYLLWPPLLSLYREHLRQIGELR